MAAMTSFFSIVPLPLASYLAIRGSPAATAIVRAPPTGTSSRSEFLRTPEKEYVPAVPRVVVKLGELAAVAGDSEDRGKQGRDHRPAGPVPAALQPSG